MTARSALTGHRGLLIVYPPLGNRFYGQLALRLSQAASELDIDARLIPASELGACDTSWIRGATALVVNPFECVLSGQAVLSPLKESRLMAAVVADCAETEWYRRHFDGGIEYGAVIDVGFIDQGASHPFPKLPYHFLFNAPLAGERDLIAALKPKYPRPLTWAFVAAHTTERVRFAQQLLSALGPECFLFLPELRPVRPGEGMLSPAALQRVLDKTTFYAWRSHHDFPYYESFRFLDAVLAGSIPCRIDKKAIPDTADLPHTFRSVEALATEAEERAGEDLFEEHREYALAHGSLADHLRKVIQGV